MYSVANYWHFKIILNKRNYCKQFNIGNTVLEAGDVLRNMIKREIVSQNMVLYWLRAKQDLGSEGTRKLNETRWQKDGLI